jgi:cytochrome P450 family 4
LTCSWYAGEKWKKSRKLITPAFHFKILEEFVEVFNKNAGILVDKLAHHVGGSEFDIYPYISLCALDSICGNAYNKVTQ